MHVAIRAILSILVCLFLPLLLASLVSSFARVGVVELTLLYIIVVGCVIYSWRYSKRKKERRLAREKTET
jgi:hypothetical protein